MILTSQTCIYLPYTSGFYGAPLVYLVFGCQTDGTVPNTLVIANCEIVKPRVAAAEYISAVTLLLYDAFAYVIFHFFFLLCTSASL